MSGDFRSQRQLLCRPPGGMPLTSRSDAGGNGPEDLGSACVKHRRLAKAYPIGCHGFSLTGT